MKIQPIFLLLFATALQAQTPTDSLRVVTASWHETKLATGVIWRESHFDTLFGSPQNINVVWVKARRRKPRLALASAGDSLKTTSWFGKNHEALVALNGTFFDVKKGGSVDFIKIDGTVFDSTKTTPGKPLAEHQQAALTIQRNRLDIAYGGNRPGWETSLPVENVMVSGPFLLENNAAHALLKNAFNDNRHPRSALGTGPRRRLLLVTVDGRHANAAGMNLHELTALLRWLGCRDALNLDGGGSTTLWLRDHGVVNYPSDSKAWIHTGERKVSNVLLVK